jgi:hypothetical protein
MLLPFLTIQGSKIKRLETMHGKVDALDVFKLSSTTRKSTEPARKAAIWLL